MYICSVIAKINKMISQELIEKNYALFKKKLEPYEVPEELIDAVFGDKLKNASFAINNENGVAYKGSLLNIILRTLTPLALKVAEILGEDVHISQDSLIKVCLLHQISKAFMFVENDNQWEIEKRGMVYKYAEMEAGLKMGMRSLLICSSLDIKFTEDEFEAMTILDRADDDKQAKFYCTPLSTAIKMANELTYIKIKNSDEI